MSRQPVDRAGKRAREGGCTELAVEFDVDNDRIIAFYENPGFEPARHVMIADVAEA